MKLVIEEEGRGELRINTEDLMMAIFIDIETGEVTDIDIARTYTIDELNRFVNAARTRYRKFMNSKEAESYKFD